MRWPVKKAPRGPDIEDVRVISQFAWWPTRIGDTWVWLESYLAEQVYVNHIVGWVIYDEWLPHRRLSAIEKSLTPKKRTF